MTNRADRKSLVATTKEARPVETYSLVLELGSLQVYSAVITDTQAPVSGPQYYWRDAGSPQGYGPFASLLACMQHHAWLLKQAKGAGSIEIADRGGTLLRVDFQRRCKVEQ